MKHSHCFLRYPPRSCQVQNGSRDSIQCAFAASALPDQMDDAGEYGGQKVRIYLQVSVSGASSELLIGTDACPTMVDHVGKRPVAICMQEIIQIITQTGSHLSATASSPQRPIMQPRSCNHSDLDPPETNVIYIYQKLLAAAWSDCKSAVWVQQIGCRHHFSKQVQFANRFS